MNIADLKKWLDGLPPEMDDAEICSAVGPFPATAKRVIAAMAKDGTCKQFIVNSMGTHLSDEFFTETKIVSILTDP